MSHRIQHPAGHVPAGETPRTPQVNKVPSTVTIDETGEWDGSKESFRPKEVDTSKLLNENAGFVVEGILGEPTPKMVTGLGVLFDGMRFQSGLNDSADPVAHSKNAGTLLIPAIRCIENNWGLLGSIAPDVLKGRTVAWFVSRREFLEYLRSLRQEVVAFARSIDNGVALVEQELDGEASTIYRQSRSVITSNARVVEKLADLKNLVSQDALTGVDTKKKNEKVAATAVDSVLAEIEAGMKTEPAGGGTPVVVPPVTHPSPPPPVGHPGSGTPGTTGAGGTGPGKKVAGQGQRAAGRGRTKRTPGK